MDIAEALEGDEWAADLHDDHIQGSHPPGACQTNLPTHSLLGAAPAQDVLVHLCYAAGPRLLNLPQGNQDLPQKHILAKPGSAIH